MTEPDDPDAPDVITAPQGYTLPAMVLDSPQAIWPGDHADRVLVTCDTCGALVLHPDTGTHTAWHAGLAPI